MYYRNAYISYDTRQYRWLVKLRTHCCGTHRTTLGDILEVLITRQARLTRAHAGRLCPKCTSLFYSDEVDPLAGTGFSTYGSVMHSGPQSQNRAHKITTRASERNPQLLLSRWPWTRDMRCPIHVVRSLTDRRHLVVDAHA